MGARFYRHSDRIPPSFKIDATELGPEFAGYDMCKVVPVRMAPERTIGVSASADPPMRQVREEPAYAHTFANVERTHKASESSMPRQHASAAKSTSSLQAD